ncbi:hypothetical protein Trydic_g16242 [Trypoxylus dichotomus]
MEHACDMVEQGINYLLPSPNNQVQRQSFKNPLNELENFTDDVSTVFCYAKHLQRIKAAFQKLTHNDIIEN